MTKENKKKIESNAGRVLFDVLTFDGQVKRIVARNVKGGYLASLKIYDETFDYEKISRFANLGIEIPIDIAQPSDEISKNVVETKIPKDLNMAYRKLADGIMPEYPDLAMIAAVIEVNRKALGLPTEGIKKLKEHYRDGVASQKRGLSVKKAITDIAKDFQDEKSLTTQAEFTLAETRQISQSLKKQNQRDVPLELQKQREQKSR